MRAVVIAALISGFVSMSFADESKEVNVKERSPDTADFSQAYLDQIKTERNSEPTSEQKRREHDQYLKDVSRADKLIRD